MNILSPLKFVLCACAFWVAGCAGLTETNRLVMLEDSTFLYERALMAGRFRAAGKFTKNDGRENPPDFTYLKNITVSDYQIIDKNSLEFGKRAVITVEIKYFHAHYLIEKTLTDLQEWEYYPEESNWYLKTGLPDFK